MDNKYFKGISDFLRDYSKIVQANAKQLLDWTNSLKNEIEVSSDDSTINISMPLYGLVIDKGRKPGAKMPPPHALDEWLKSKSIPLSAAYPIARSIGINGIPARPWINEALDLRSLNKKIVELIVVNIVTDIQEKNN